MDRESALLAKYAEMRELRLGDLDGSILDPRPRMAALAATYPGALREIDELPLGEIERRIEHLSRLLAPGPPSPEPWVALSWRYHALLRGALGAKRWLARRQPDEALRASFEREAGALPHGGDVLAWGDQLAQIASPPRGRLTPLVLRRLAEETGAPPEHIARQLFGHGRRLRGGAHEPS